MAFTINRKLVPIKAHYFFFMAALGPILPQINVIGRQLGVSPDIMGIVTSILPILYVIAKPCIGYLADYFFNNRKLIFVLVIFIMSLSYTGYAFLPPIIGDSNFVEFSNFTSELSKCDNSSHHQTINCTVNSLRLEFNFDEQLRKLCVVENDTALAYNESISSIKCELGIDSSQLYKSWPFWAFVLLTCLGTIGFNVGNCISDAICFDVLGDKTMRYGSQRVFGTIGFGLTALIAGYAVDRFIASNPNGNFTIPAVIVMIIFTVFDLLSIRKLKLPQLSSTDSIYKDVKELLKNKKVTVFLAFATIAGILDSFIIYYMFWHLEDLAEKTGYTHQIKLIEGWVVAAECLGGEILFFLVSGKILKKMGYVHCLSFCFFNYALRLALISIIPNPWYLVGVEFFMQGASYALCYTCIVAYAAAIAPPGTSATVQGLVAGMDDGLGFSIGSLIGGQVFRRYGGEQSFKFFALLAILTCFSHIILRPASKHETHDSKKGKYATPDQHKEVKMIVVPSAKIEEDLENL